MAWTSGDFAGLLTARAVVAFIFGEDITPRQLVDAVKIEDVVYAAARCKGTQRVWGIVFVVNREGTRLHVKPISEHIGPFDDRCFSELRKVDSSHSWPETGERSDDRLPLRRELDTGGAR